MPVFLSPWIMMIKIAQIVVDSPDRTVFKEFFSGINCYQIVSQYL